MFQARVGQPGHRAPADAQHLGRLVDEHGAQATPIGTVTDGGLVISVGAERVVDVAVEALREPYDTAIPRAMGEAVAAV